MAFLQDLFTHYNRTLTTTTRKIWTDYLDRHLSKKEQIEAIAKALIEDNYLPTAEKLVEKIKGNPIDKAFDSWMEIVQLSRKYVSTFEIYEQIKDSDLLSFYCLQKVGGVSLLSASGSSKLKEIKADFVKIYIDVYRKKTDVTTLIDWTFLENNKKDNSNEEINDPITPEQFAEIRAKLKKMF